MGSLAFGAFNSRIQQSNPILSMSTAAAISRNIPFVIVPKRHADDRGWLSETFRSNRLHDIGIPYCFVQENQSWSRRAGTLRGLHFQLPPAAHAKLFTVIRGRVLDIVVDVRQKSPTYGQHIAVELSAETGHLFYVPVGFAHGFMTLEDDVVVLYKLSDYYAPSHDAGIRWMDPSLNLPRSVNGAEVIVSDKDRNLPLLKDFVSPFAYGGNELRPLQRDDYVML